MSGESNGGTQSGGWRSCSTQRCAGYTRGTKCPRCLEAEIRARIRVEVEVFAIRWETARGM